MNTQTQYIKRPARRADWLGIRKGFVGGSDVAALLGLSPWKTPVDLYLDKTGRVPDEDEANEAMRLGSYLEDYAARRYAEETGRTVRNFGYMVAKGHAVADVDRLVGDGDALPAHHADIRTDTLLECKTAGAFWDEEPPLHYQTQVHLYMELTGCRFADFAVVFLAPRRDFRIYRVERDEKIGAALLARIEAFWRDFVEADTPPPAVNLADVRALYPNARPDTPVDASPEVARAVERLREIKAREDELDAEAEGLRGAVAAFMGEADTLRIGGAKAVTFKAPKPSLATDWKAVSAACKGVAAFDEAVAANTKPREASRRFLLCASK